MRSLLCVDSSRKTASPGMVSPNGYLTSRFKCALRMYVWSLRKLWWDKGPRYHFERPRCVPWDALGLILAKYPHVPILLD